MSCDYETVYKLSLIGSHSDNVCSIVTIMTLYFLKTWIERRRVLSVQL